MNTLFDVIIALKMISKQRLRNVYKNLNVRKSLFKFKDKQNELEFSPRVVQWPNPRQ